MTNSISTSLSSTRRFAAPARATQQARVDTLGAKIDTLTSDFIAKTESLRITEQLVQKAPSGRKTGISAVGAGAPVEKAKAQMNSSLKELISTWVAYRNARSELEEILEDAGEPFEPIDDDSLPRLLTSKTQGAKVETEAEAAANAKIRDPQAIWNLHWFNDQQSVLPQPRPDAMERRRCYLALAPGVRSAEEEKAYAMDKGGLTAATWEAMTPEMRDQTLRFIATHEAKRQWPDSMSVEDAADRFN
jgi:hypothetical protein